MIAKLKENPLLSFLVIGALAYLGWYVLYEFVLRPHSALDEWVVDQIVKGTESVLQLVGYDLRIFDDGLWRNHVGILGSPGVTIGAPCDGIILFALFSIFVIAYPGPWKHKAWYIPIGVLAIHWMNVLRVVALAVIVHYRPDWLDFNHDYTFTIVVYSFVFLLWYIWVQKFAPRNRNAQESAAV